MIMAIGDLAYDNSPIQISQFESDIRIAENLDKIYFENGGGGNDYESYTAAWYMGLKHCKLDCWNRGKKGLIITMGDEPINPYLPASRLNEATGDTCQADVETPKLFEDASKKFDIYHISVESGAYPNQDREHSTFANVIGTQHAIISSVDKISDKIISIVEDFAKKSNQSIIVESPNIASSENEISWRCQMKRNSSHRYVAIDKDGNIFTIEYGKNVGKVKISNNVSDLASYIAYYYHRCYAKVMQYKNGKLMNVSKSVQDDFQAHLNSEFFFHEMK